MRFFFDIRTGDELIEDPDGSELPHVDAARAEAVAAAREMLAEDLLAGRPLDGRTFEIRQLGHGVVATLPFEKAIAVR